MNILVTGGAGYIGSLLVPALLNKGFKVHVTDNFMYNQYTALLSCCSNYNLSVENKDITLYSETEFRKFLAPFDIIIPLAALVGAPICEKYEYKAKEVNYSAVANIADCAKSDVLIIYPNTNSGYGVVKDEPATEKTSLNPISIYGKTKCRAEKTLLTSHENSIVFRLATLYGISPRMRIDLLVNDFVYRAVRDSTLTLFQPYFKRSLVHIRDVVNAFLFAIENKEKMKGEIYNIVGDNRTKLEICQKITDIIPNFHPCISSFREDPDKRDYFVNGEKIMDLGFNPSYSLEEGIEELIKGYSMLRNEQFGNI